MVNVKKMLAAAIEHGASDVHINVAMPPIMRINTELVVMDLPPVNNEEVRQMVLGMIGDEKFKRFERDRDIDFSTRIDDGSRFRVNAHYQRDSLAISYRVISNQIPRSKPCTCP